MLKTPKVMYSCDHLIDIIKTDPLISERVKDSSDYDTICDNGVISSIQNLYTLDLSDNPTFFAINTDFIIYDSTQIQWISANRPIAGEHFFVEYVNLVRHVDGYNILNCPRCGGNAWFVGLFEDKGKFVKKMSGINKLIQDFVKILLTYKVNDYGSTLLDIAGANVSDESLLKSEILRIIYGCESTYKKLQLSDIESGSQLSDDERLKSVRLNDMEVVADMGAVIISITLISEAGKSSTANFSI